MTRKEINIADKTVIVAYCYATEIGFRRLTGVSIDEFDAKNSEHVLYLILSAILSYYQSRDEEAPISDTDLLYNTKPSDIIAAMTAIFKLRAAWYEVPAGEPEEKKGDEESKKNTPSTTPTS